MRTLWIFLFLRLFVIAVHSQSYSQSQSCLTDHSWPVYSQTSHTRNFAPPVTTCGYSQPVLDTSELDPGIYNGLTHSGCSAPVSGLHNGPRPTCLCAPVPVSQGIKYSSFTLSGLRHIGVSHPDPDLCRTLRSLHIHTSTPTSCTLTRSKRRPFRSGRRKMRQSSA
ncbi:hypothetical protein BaRGS_00011162, partial [Batillaria attramentaria]